MCVVAGDYFLCHVQKVSQMAPIVMKMKTYDVLARLKAATYG